MPTASSSRSRRSPKPLPKSIPKASCSRSNHPPPSPSTERPPLIWSTVVASLAVRPGLRNVFAATSRPICARLVVAARRPASPSPRACRRPRRPHRRGGGRRPRRCRRRPARRQRRHRGGSASRSAGSRMPRRSGSGGVARVAASDRCYARAMVVSGRSISLRLFRWHESARRPLLIREAATPWEILVAEVMSQQTGIERVGPAWRRFIERWPAPADLAERRHPRTPRGLGRARVQPARPRTAAGGPLDRRGPRGPRARNRRGPGAAPRDRAVHRTCRSPASAFGVPVAPLDVNVRRVLSRVLGVPPTMPGLQAAGDGLVSRGQPGRWLDAVMDLASRDVPASRAALRRVSSRRRCARPAARPSPGRPAEPRRALPATTRWLRGRLVAALATGAVGDVGAAA